MSKNPVPIVPGCELARLADRQVGYSSMVVNEAVSLVISPDFATSSLGKVRCSANLRAGSSRGRTYGRRQ
jgi:hypothetical protein